MGRKKKFKPGDVAWYEKTMMDTIGHDIEVRQYCVIVDYYRTEGQGQAGYYIVIDTTGPDIQMNAISGARWVKSNLLHKVPDSYKMKTILSRYRNNKNLVDRGCSCNCCIHTAIPPRFVTADGQLAWDVEGDEDE